jgi:hypothetical protein
MSGWTEVETEDIDVDSRLDSDALADRTGTSVGSWTQVEKEDPASPGKSRVIDSAFRELVTSLSCGDLSNRRRLVTSSVQTDIQLRDDPHAWAARHMLPESTTIAVAAKILMTKWITILYSVAVFPPMKSFSVSAQ